MKRIMKRMLPDWLKQKILKTMELPDQLLSPIFKSNLFLASIYYALFSRKFGREHKAVLAGKTEYQKSLKDINKTSVLLRRNTHRLEKGLIMQPRRDIFAEQFIGETLKIYQRAIELGNLDLDENKWVMDVLTEYFKVVKDTKTITKARYIFDQIAERDKQIERFIPYPFDNLPKTNIEFDELHKLFIKRRSVRWYQNKEVSMALIENAVKLASLAPSACNRQPYTFYVSQNKEKAVELAKCAGGTPGWVENIPCIIVIVGDLSAYPYERDRHLIYIDSSLAAMQLMLALETLNLSSCSINWPDVEVAENKMRNLLELKPYERPIMLLSVGYAQNKGLIPYSQKKDANYLIKKV
jgi:nitroreductase